MKKTSDKKTKKSRKQSGRRAGAPLAAASSALSRRAKVRAQEAAGASTKPPEKTAADSKNSFPIVGVGASAGGLEAFTKLLANLPANTGMGFVLLQHLDPLHESALAEILTRATSMPVQEATNDLRVEPNHVYVIPPNKSMEIVQGVLKLRIRSDRARGAQHLIDVFFESLANDRGGRAIGVVLSGTASDGTLGLEAIKAGGGITFVQDESAKFDSMPRSAIAAGCVDFVLPPEAIAKEIARIARHPFVAGDDARFRLPEAESAAVLPEDPDHAPASGGKSAPRAGAKAARTGAPAAGDLPLSAEQDGFKKILPLLRNHCGVDFSLYKSSTIRRRVARRMVLNRQETPGDYAAFLRNNTKELDALYSDVLIGVTGFFRNADAFDALKRKVFPALLAQRGRTGPLRVWTLGCSTGQEAYSIAMAFAEFSDKAARAPKLQVFATDLNEAALEKARRGLYAKTLVQDLSPERLRRFFAEEEGGYRIDKTLREQVVFARHNVMNDPPFSRLDVISCRNLLIYFEAGLQKKIMPAFHYALKPGGFLFLGASESVGPFTALFEATDMKHKIFSRKAAPTPAFRLPLPQQDRPASPAPGKALPAPAGAPGLPARPRGELDARREADRLSVSQFAPPGVLVDAELQVLQFRGATRDFLEPPSGQATFDVLKMACEGLMLPLSAAIRQAKRDGKTVRREHVRLRKNGATRAIHLQVTPLANLKERCYLILFEEAEAPRRSAVTPARAAGPAAGKKLPPQGKNTPARRVVELERELSDIREDLVSLRIQSETSTEELKSANEQLQSSSEEMQSANEELQSLNEELETSKEELESTNEELTTVNEEMTNRNAELKGLNNDLSNLHMSIGTAILVLGRDLTLRRFTVQAEKIFNLLAADVGRPLGGIRHNLDCRDLEEFVREVIDTVSVRQREVRDKDGRWYSLRARPYLTLDNKIDGAVLVLVDIDALKTSEQEIKGARAYAQAILRTKPNPLLVLRTDLRVDTANEAFYQAFKVAPADTEGRLIYEIGNRQWNIPKLRELLEDILPLKSIFNGYEVAHDFETLGHRTMLLNARRMDNERGVPERILLAIEDITERKQAAEALRSYEARYRTLFDSMDEGFCVVEVLFDETATPQDFRHLEVNPAFEKQSGLTQVVVGRTIRELVPGIERYWIELYGRVALTGTPVHVESYVAEIKRWFQVSAFRTGDPADRKVACLFTDITERKHAAEALRESEARFRVLVTASSDVVYRMNPDWSEMGQRDGRNFVADTQGPSRTWFTDNIHPDDRAHVRAVIDEAIRTKGVFELEHRVRRANGAFGWTFSRAVPLLDAQGEIVEWFGAASDVTERKETEEALRLSERRLEGEVGALAQLHELSGRLWRKSEVREGLEDMLDAAIALLGADMGNVQMLDPHKKVLEIIAQRGFREDFLEFFREVTADHDSACGRTLREGRRTIIEDVEADAGFAPYREIAAAAGYRGVQSTPLIGRDGTVYGMLSTHFRAPHRPSEQELRRLDLYIHQAVDFIERINGEHALKEREERVRLALAGAGMGSWRGNLRTGLGTRDANLNRLLGLPPAESTQTIHERFKQVHADDRAAAVAAMRRATVEKESYEIEYRVIPGDGPARWLSEKGSFIAGENGGPDFVTGVIVDITGRKTAEAALHEAIESLLKAQLVAARASRAKDDFLAALSHELRTPLTPVLMTAAALQEDERLPADVRRQLRMIERNITLEARLIDDLLDLTAISHGKLHLRAQLCDAHSLIGFAIEIVCEEALEKEIRIERDLAAHHGWLVADPARFQQVVWNLLRNAVKFTPSGGKIAIRTSDGETPEGGRLLRIEVADSGIGIDAAMLERIFLPFDQGDLVGEHRFGGVGLGLAIARAVVELHGGRISARSAGKDRGATFVVELPGALAPQADPVETAIPVPAGPPAAPATPGPVPITPLRLLVVEDHRTTLQILARLLRSDGHLVVTATTLAEALAAAAAQPFDHVISDLGLPDGSGADLMAKLRDTYGLRGIAMSGYGMEDDFVRSREAGFATHLVKPVSIAELRRVIAALPPMQN